MKRLLTVSALAILLAACGKGEQTIRIGYIGPLTGDAAAIGSDTLNGVRIAVDQVNAAGGIDGKKVEVIAEDGRCNGADATSAVQKLIEIDRVIAIIGGQCSSETLAAAPVAEAAKVPLISPVSSSPDVTKAGEYVFRVYPSDALKGKAMATYFQTAGYKKIAVISENTDYCQGTRSSIKKELAAGTSFVFDEVVEQGTKDYRTLMTRLKKIDFDAFVVNGQSDVTVAEMVKQMRALGMTQQIIGSDTADTLNLAKLAGVAVEGLKPLAVPGLSEERPEAAEFARIFRQRYDEPMFNMFFAGLAHDAAKLTIEQIGKVGSGEALQKALLSATHDGVVGAISFDENGDVIGIPYAMKQFKDGKLVQTDLIPLN